MEKIITAKVKIGKLQAKIVNRLCNNETSYEPKDLATQATQEHPEAVSKSNELVKKLLDSIKEHNHFGNTQQESQQFEAYIVKRSEESDDDFDLIFTDDNGSLKLCLDSVFEELQSCWEWMLEAKDESQPEVKRLYKAIDTGTRNWSIGFNDFRTKSNQMHELQHGITESDKSNAVAVQKSREELGWEVLKRDCRFMSKWGFTCYKITEFEQINNTCHKSPWCVTWDNGGRHYFYEYDSQRPPYYLITIGDEKPYALLNPSSHQFKSYWDDYHPFKPEGKVDRPSKTKIFEFANEILDKCTEFDGKYIRDFSVLKNPVKVELDDINFIDIIADENCPQDTLDEAIRNTSDENIKNALARNSNIPYDNLVQMAQSPSSSRAVLQTIGTSPKLTDELANMLLDRDKSCCITIALNPKCSESVMKRIINGKYDKTGAAYAGLLRKDYCKQEYIDYFVKKDKSEMLYENAEMYSSLLQNPKTDEETLKYVIDRAKKLQDSQKKEDILSLCYRHPNLSQQMIQEKMQSLQKLKSEYDTMLHAHQLGQHPEPFKISEKDKKDLAQILANPKCDEKILAQVTNMFYDRPDDAEILISVAENPSTPAKSIEKIVKRIRKNLNLALALIKNPNCPPGALEPAAILVDQVSEHKDSRTRIKLINAIIKNKGCTDSIRNKILFRPTFENIRDTLFPEDLLIPLCKSDDIDIAYIAALRLKQAYGKKVLPDGTVVNVDKNSVEASDKNKFNRIVASVVTDQIALKIAKALI